MEGNNGFFQVDKKFHTTNSKLREQPFSTKTLIRKYQISKSRGAKTTLPLSDAHGLLISPSLYNGLVY